MRFTFAIAASVALFAALVSPVAADTDVFDGNIHIGSPQDGGTNPDGEGRQTFNFSPGITLGTNFVANIGITINQLGIWDDNGDGLLSGHTVLLFDAADPGTALATLVTSAGTGDLRGGYRYFDLAAPILLDAGTEFQVGVLYGPGNQDSNGNAGAITQNLEPRPTFNVTDGFVSLGTISNFAIGAGFGTINDPTGDRYHAGSFNYTPNPEPGTMVLLSGVLGAVVLHRRRKKRRQTA